MSILLFQFHMLLILFNESNSPQFNRITTFLALGSVRDAYYDYIGNDHTDMILMLGDNAYGAGSDDNYKNAVFTPYASKLANTVLWSCPGNHDYEEQEDNCEGAAAYYDIFSFPQNGEAGGLASNTERYYSFDYGNIHIISMDSHDEPRFAGSPMLTWLESDLAATTREWIVVIFHHPPYSKGSHNSDDPTNSGGKIDRPNQLIFTFNYEGLISLPPKSIVQIEIEEISPNQSQLMLTQEFITIPSDMANRTASWNFMFQTLENKLG